MDVSLLKQGKNKFLIKTKDVYLAISTIKKRTTIAVPGYSLELCKSSEDFIDSFHERSLFEEKKKALILHEYDNTHLSVLADIFESDTDNILFFLPKEPLPKNKSASRIKSSCHPITFSKPSKDSCITQIKSLLDKNKVKYSPGTPDYIFSVIVLDPVKIERELLKIVYFFSSYNSIITEKDCQTLLSGGGSIDNFYFIESFFRKRFNIVFKEIKKIKEYDFIKLVFFIRSQVEQAYKVSTLKSMGLSSEDISNELGLPLFIVNTKIMPILSHYGKVKLLKMLDLLNELDEKVRTTKFKKDLVFESYLIKMMKL